MFLNHNVAPFTRFCCCGCLCSTPTILLNLRCLYYCRLIEFLPLTRNISGYFRQITRLNILKSSHVDHAFNEKDACDPNRNQQNVIPSLWVFLYYTA